MNKHVKTKKSSASLVKADPVSPAIKATGPTQLIVVAGTTFSGHHFKRDTPVALKDLEPGGDYVVLVKNGKTRVARMTSSSIGADVLGGFHFAPGGNATAIAGGDKVPAINPFSVWDRSFRPACPDPRGMTLVQTPSGQFWCDIYLLGVDHLGNGTSTLGATIADGNALPQKPSGGKFERFNYAAAVDVMNHHGKGLLSAEEAFAAFYGVTEKTACGSDPKVTKLDAPRTSKWGVIQATGNMWVWGHCGHPDLPRASVFGGYWAFGVDAGSRRAYVGCYWPVDSFVSLGARGRSDHLQLG